MTWSCHSRHERRHLLQTCAEYGWREGDHIALLWAHHSLGGTDVTWAAQTHAFGRGERGRFRWCLSSKSHINLLQSASLSLPLSLGASFNLNRSLPLSIGLCLSPLDSLTLLLSLCLSIGRSLSLGLSLSLGPSLSLGLSLSLGPSLSPWSLSPPSLPSLSLFLFVLHLLCLFLPLPFFLVISLFLSLSLSLSLPLP